MVGFKQVSTKKRDKSISSNKYQVYEIITMFVTTFQGFESKILGEECDIKLAKLLSI